MEALVRETGLEGARLMARLRELMPGATINDILDEARLIHIYRVAEVLKGFEFKTGIELLEYLSASHLTEEDLDTLSLILVENSKAWVTSECAQDLSIFITHGLFHSTMNFILKLKTPVPEPGCFTWASRLRNRHRPRP